MIRLMAALAGLTVLAGCESLSSPSGVLDIFNSDTCPEYQTGAGPFEPPFPDNCDQMMFSASGLRWIELAEGARDKGSPGTDATVVISYEGFLASTGAVVDSSYAKGESSVLDIAELTDGLAEAAQRMSPGDEWLVYIPSELAFGAEAHGDVIPANSDLVFRLRLDGFLSVAEIEEAAGLRDED